jgi:hypothetical protein
MNTLPTISVPNYRLTIPSTKESVAFRPYLVREEKLLMIASESEDQEQIEDAVIQVVEDCLEYGKSIKELTAADLEFIFIQLRSKSVGETLDIIKVCDECEGQTEVSINIQEAYVKAPEEVDFNVKLSDDLTLELRFPTLSNKVSYNEDVSDTDILIKNAANSLSVIYYGEDTYDAKSVSVSEREEFIGSLSTEQFNKIIDFLMKAPYVTYDGKFTCSKCGHKHEFNYTGLIDFFI